MTASPAAPSSRKTTAQGKKKTISMSKTRKRKAMTANLMENGLIPLSSTGLPHSKGVSLTALKRLGPSKAFRKRSTTPKAPKTAKTSRTSVIFPAEILLKILPIINR